MRIATLGYAVPGPVLAVGIVIPLAWVDQQWISFAKNWLGLDTGLLLQGTLLVMLPAYLTRFLAVGFNPVDSAMQRITRSLDETSRSFGVTGVAMLRRVHLPMLRGGLLYCRRAGVRGCHEGNADYPDDPPVRLGHAGGADF